MTAFAAERIRLGGAVVLLQQHGVRVREVALELGDVADARAAEGVDRLVRVADHAQLTRLGTGVRGRDQLADQHVLRVVRVLVLVDEDVAEPAPVVLGDVRQPLQQRDRLHDQVVEVEGVRRAQPRLVERVDLGDAALVLVRGPLGGLLGAEQLVLEVRDLRGQPAGGELLGVELQVAGDEPDEPARVVGVVDRELAAHARGAWPRGAGCARTSSGTSTPTSPATGARPGRRPAPSSRPRPCW